MTDTTDQGVVETPAPDANVVPEAPETPEVETTNQESSPEADGDVSEEEGEGKPRGGFQRRIAELTRARRDAEREAARKAAEADYFREMALRSTRQEPDTQAEPEAPAAPEPVKTLAEFNYDEAQYTAYLRQQIAADARKAAAELIRQDREREASERKVQTFRQRVEDFKKSAPDFEDLVLSNRSLPITEGMAAVIQDSEDGPAVAYHLGKHPEEASRIARLDPVSAARELGKIEARLAFEREQVRKPAPKPPVSQAPPPPPKLDAVEPAVDPDPDKMSWSQWVKWREKQLSRKKA